MIKRQTSILLYLAFIAAVTLSTIERSSVGWAELGVWLYGAGLFVAEAIQLRNGWIRSGAKSESCCNCLHVIWENMAMHFASLWNVLDAVIVLLVSTCAWQRLAQLHMNDGSFADGIVWEVADLTSGSMARSLLCLLMWVRLLGILLMHSEVGPLVSRHFTFAQLVSRYKFT